MTIRMKPARAVILTRVRGVGWPDSYTFPYRPHRAQRTVSPQSGEDSHHHPACLTTFVPSTCMRRLFTALLDNPSTAWVPVKWKGESDQSTELGGPHRRGSRVREGSTLSALPIASRDKTPEELDRAAEPPSPAGLPAQKPSGRPEPRLASHLWRCCHAAVASKPDATWSARHCHASPPVHEILSPARCRNRTDAISFVRFCFPRFGFVPLVPRYSQIAPSNRPGESLRNPIG